jgi:CheY-like chemotaxis protein
LLWHNIFTNTEAMHRILLVDDDELSRSTIHQMLERMGHKVLSTANGSEALRLCREHSAELVITDLIMPDTDGLELIQDLRRSAPEIRIVAISGGGRVNANEYLTVARKFGAVAVLAKPFSNLELREAIEQAVGD